MDRDEQSGDPDLKLRQQSAEIRELLARPWWKPFRGSPRDPERRKNLDRLCTAIEDVRGIEQPNEEEAAQRFVALRELLLAAHPARDNADSLGLLLERVDEEMTRFADTAYLGAQLAFEEQRDTPPPDEWVALWGDKRDSLFNKVASETATSTDICDVRRKLRIWYRSRHQLYVFNRSRNGARAKGFRLLAFVIAILVFVLIVLVDWTSSSMPLRQGLLVAFTGALGATLSLAFRLRDTPQRLRDLRTFGSGFALQAALGAAAGTITWILLHSGLVDIGNTGSERWAVDTMFAFLAGFSEPWLLNTVQKLASTDTRTKPDATKSPSAA